MGSLEVRVLDLNTVLKAMHRMLRPLIHEDVELLMVLDPEVGNVKADPAQLQQAIINLAVNARQAMPYGGKLIFETRNVQISEEFAKEHQMAAGSYVLLAISDTGCGMSSDIQASLFKPFFTTKGPAKGTGLGLAAVQAIVRHIGGEIFVSSEVDKGSRFKIYIPRVTAE
jgi:signal transduction histidine kinase